MAISQNRIRVLGCVAVAVCAVIFLPAAFGDRQSDSWTKFVYDYQTLLTGAVAFITVGQMRASDERQDLRHDKMVQVAVRTDVLAVQRLREYLPTKLHAPAKILSHFQQFSGDPPLSEQPWSESKYRRSRDKARR